MSYFDVIIVCVLLGFAFFGFWSGLLQSVGSIIGTLAGAYVAHQYFETIAPWVIERTGWSENTARIVVFFLLFAVITRLVGLIFLLAEKFLHILPIPFGRLFNKILGGIFGFTEGLIALGLFVYLLGRFPLSGKLAEAINASMVIEWVRPVIDRTVEHSPWFFTKLMQWL